MMVAQALFCLAYKRCTMLVIVIIGYIDHDLFFINVGINLIASLSNIGWIRDCVTYFCVLKFGE